MNVEDLTAQRKRSGNLRFRVPPVGVIDTPVLVVDHERDCTFVRILQVVTKTKILYMGSQIVTVEEWYLDGTHTVESYTADRKHNVESTREIMPAEHTIRAARTKDTIDFGRFQEASVALIGQVEAAQKDPGNDYLEETVFRSYQGILEWREALRRQVDDVDATIDVVAAKVRSMAKQ